VNAWLAVDTATDHGQVAVGEPGARPLGSATLAPRTHAKTLLSSARALLQAQGLNWGDVEGVVVGDGPGSFTGLRIAWSTVKGIVSVRPSLQVHTAPSLVAAAHHAAVKYDAPSVCAVYDAMRGEVFAAVYEFDRGGPVERLRPTLTTIPDLTRRAAPALAVGDGVRIGEALLRDWTGRDPVAPPTGMPTAAALLALVAAHATRVVSDIDRFEPEYGRKAEAQVRWEHEHGRRLPGA